jgi:diaminohydroxyphosphoribosylaminopyrimidine deaminase/5-amino-6-(5-phosphoribosylamino)uracil reductase
LTLNSRLAETAAESPVLVAAAADADENLRTQLAATGVEVYLCPGQTHDARLLALLDELGRRRMTNVLVEGGSKLLGAFFDASAVDEVHIFIAPKLAGGAEAPSPVAGAGIARMADARQLADITIEELDGDVYVHGRLKK